MARSRSLIVFGTQRLRRASHWPLERTAAANSQSVQTAAQLETYLLQEISSFGWTIRADPHDNIKCKVGFCTVALAFIIAIEMYRLLITAVVLTHLWHVVAGCCWHHAPACASSCCEARPAAVDACPCGDHRNTESDQVAGQPAHDGPQHRDEHQHDCAGAHCTFLRFESSRGHHGALPFDVLPLEIPHSVSDANRVQHGLVLGPHDHRIHVGRPLRTHLLLGVLLI